MVGVEVCDPNVLWNLRRLIPGKHDFVKLHALYSVYLHDEHCVSTACIVFVRRSTQCWEEQHHQQSEEVQDLQCGGHSWCHQVRLLHRERTQHLQCVLLNSVQNNCWLLAISDHFE